jgi:Flp pilus assembly protein TadB
MSSLILLILILVGTLISFGVYQIILSFSKAPNPKISKTLKNIQQRHKERTAKNAGVSESFAQLIAKFIRINEFKRAKLLADLKSAGIDETPEMYKARALSQLIMYLLIAIPFLFIFPIIAPVILILAVLKFIQSNQRIKDNIQEKRKQIEMDLPRFVDTIVYELTATHDPLVIMEKHIGSYSEMFGRELTITVADMRSGNYEAALQRLEARVGSSNLSEVVRGLIEMVKGNDTHIYWETLSFRFAEMQKQELRKMADKVPPKVRRLSFFLLLTIMAVYFVVLGSVLVDGMKSLF